MLNNKLNIFVFEQILYDISAILRALSKYIEFSNSWETQVKEVEDQVIACD